MEALGTSVCLLVCLCLCAPAGAKGKGDQEAEIVRQLLLRQHVNRTELDTEYISTSQKRSNTFHCPVLAPSPTAPTSVHKLRPGDISVVAALGDSLTAGRGVELGILGLLFDFPFLSWSIGGDGDYSSLVTIPNILRNYNPYLYGYSVKTGLNSRRFNVAETGANSRDLLAQAEKLVKLMREDTKVDFANSWKLITIFIGANDLCDYCDDETAFSAQAYYNNLKTTLDYLQAHVPRAFVNLVEVLNVEMVRNLGENPLCQAVHNAVCKCVANPKNEQEAQRAVLLREEYQKVTRDLIASGRYDTQEDFTAVLQPFYENTTLPTAASGSVDLSYFAKDCFHYSRKGQQTVAEALWDNMFEPVGSKDNSWRPGQPIKCPTETSPYLYTAKNSNSAGTY